MDLNAAYGEESFKDIAGRRLDALILTGCLVDQSEAVRRITSHGNRRGVPLVEIRDRRATESQTDQVIADYRAAAVAAMQHLIDLGHRRIGLVYAVAQTELGDDRLEPYRQALASVGVAPDAALEVHCGAAIEEGYAAARQLLALPEPPTAILAINDVMAIATLRAAGDCGLRVPEDLSVIGFDDIPEAHYLVPRLTTATKDAVRLGREAVGLVLSRLQEPDRPLQEVIVPSTFLVRESTARAQGS
jgi:DNA-binding LacI/PurR family transcriptional regulator